MRFWYWWGREQGFFLMLAILYWGLSFFWPNFIYPASLTFFLVGILDLLFLLRYKDRTRVFRRVEVLRERYPEGVAVFHTKVASVDYDLVAHDISPEERIEQEYESEHLISMYIKNRKTPLIFYKHGRKEIM